MKLAAYLLSEIRRQGIAHVFGVPGRENAHILFNECEGLSYLTTRVEFTAGMMAEFAGRATAKPQVCFCTMGPGATNMVTAMAGARLNRAPVLLISAQLESNDRFYNLTHQCVDQRSVLEPVTKWSHELSSPHELPDVLDKAWALMMTEPPGPVHISIPVDFFRSEIDETKHIPSSVRSSIQIENGGGDEDKIANIHRILASASRPVCVIGHELIRLHQEEAALAFCRSWNIPFVCGANANGIASANDPLNYGTVSCYMEGILGYPALDDMFLDADVILCLGYQYVDDILPKMWHRGRAKAVVCIGANSLADIRAQFHPEIECIGSTDVILERLTARGVHRKPNAPIPKVRERYEAILNDTASRDGYLTPTQVIAALNRSWQKKNEESILVTDIGYYRHHAILFSRPNKPRQFFSDTGLSSFGTGLPSAAAAQLLNPNHRVFLICGDGGFHSGSGDLETLVRYRLPVVVVVLNNSAFRLIHLYQKRNNEQDHPDVISLGRVDFAKLAEANGCFGKSVSNTLELIDAIDSHDRSRPLVIDVPFHYEDGVRFQESF